VFIDIFVSIVFYLITSIADAVTIIHLKNSLVTSVLH